MAFWDIAVAQCKSILFMSPQLVCCVRVFKNDTIFPMAVGSKWAHSHLSKLHSYSSFIKPDIFQSFKAKLHILANSFQCVAQILQLKSKMIWRLLFGWIGNSIVFAFKRFFYINLWFLRPLSSHRTEIMLCSGSRNFGGFWKLGVLTLK